MGAVSTLAVTVAAAMGAIALYRFVDRKTGELRNAIDEANRRSKSGNSNVVIDYERDPDSGVFKPKT